jgi:hypothetical protein
MLRGCLDGDGAELARLHRRRLVLPFARRVIVSRSMSAHCLDASMRRSASRRAGAPPPPQAGAAGDEARDRDPEQLGMAPRCLDGRGAALVSVDRRRPRLPATQVRDREPEPLAVLP